MGIYHRFMQRSLDRWLAMRMSDAHVNMLKLQLLQSGFSTHANMVDVGQREFRYSFTKGRLGDRKDMVEIVIEFCPDYFFGLIRFVFFSVQLPGIICSDEFFSKIPDEFCRNSFLARVLADEFLSDEFCPGEISAAMSDAHVKM